MTAKSGPGTLKSQKPGTWTRAQVSIGITSIIYIGFLVWLWVVTLEGPERSWLVNTNLYLPQVFWAIPSVILLVRAFFVRKKRHWLLALPLISLPIIFGPLMGLRGFPSPAQPPASAASKPLHVVTYNVEFGRNTPGVLAVIQGTQPDILMLQDMGGNVETLLRSWYPDWNFQRKGEFMIGSFYPIKSFVWTELPKPSQSQWKRFGYARAELQIDSEKIAVYTTHLLTPRSALMAVRSRDADAAVSMEANNNLRVYQASVVAKAIQGEKLPFVLGGDFNAPEASMTCGLILRAGTRDAFSEAGKGYGYTFGHKLRFGESFIRIDHLFVSKHWAVDDCTTGDKIGSDHRPMVTTLRLASTVNQGGI